MNALPNLAKIATADLVETIGGGSFKASYINWSRTLHLLREHAPGWLPELVRAPDGNILHAAPVGAFLLLRFRHVDGTVTPEVPQAIMDTHNKAVPIEKITARDITDTHRRGACLAAALTFGLAYELWAKMPLESGYTEGEDVPDHSSEWIDAIQGCHSREELDKLAAEIKEANLPGPAARKARAAWSARAHALKAAA